MTEPITLAEKLTQFSEHWAPRTVAQLSCYDVSLHPQITDFVNKLLG